MKTKMFIDFDGTIFNTKAFKEKMFKAVSNLGFSDEDILMVYKEECLDKHFSLTDFIEKLRKLKKINLEDEIKHVDAIYSSAQNLIFDDFIKFIESTSREKYEINLLTLGDLEFQKMKVESSGVAKYFDNIFYTVDEKWDYLKELVEVDEKFFLIDDRSDTISKVSQAFPNSVCLWIDRRSRDLDDPALSMKKYDDIEIRNFDDVTKYLG